MDGLRVRHGKYPSQSGVQGGTVYSVNTVLANIINDIRRGCMIAARRPFYSSSQGAHNPRCAQISEAQR